MHVVECYPPANTPFKGTVLLVHGFPDSWYGWRHQIRPIAACGFHVLVPDQRGYGYTVTPEQLMGPEHFAMEELCKDNLALLDAMGIHKAVFLGHDWGGSLVWNMCLHHPERCSAVGAVCTPFFANNPHKNPWVEMRRPEKVGRFDYQMWFQTAEAEAEWERDVSRALKLTIRGTSAEDVVMPADAELAAKPPTVKNGLFSGMPEDPPRSAILTERDVAYYTRQFEASGLRGPMNWYRNVERNWQWNRSVAGLKVTQRALMITTGRDDILIAKAAHRLMPAHFEQLTFQHVEEAGHWVLQEQIDAVNQHIVQWLGSLPHDINHLGASKL